MMDAISINVSGRRFEVSQQTFCLLLQAMGPRIQSTPSSFINGRKEYFFERHSDVFQSILCYYQTGELHMPQCVCPTLYQKELEFWAVGESNLSKCCYNKYMMALDNYKKIMAFEEYFTVRRRSLKLGSSRQKHLREYCWQLMNDPFTSLAAQVYFWLTMSLVVLSITVICMTTMPEFQGDIPIREFPAWVQDYFIRHYGQILYMATVSNSTNNTYEEFIHSEEVKVTFIVPYLFELQIAFYIIFTIEFCILIIFCPSVKSFISTPLYLLDLLALVPFYVWLIIDAAVPHGPFIRQAESVLTGIAIIRVFRLLRLARRIKGLRVLLFAIKSSLDDVFLLMLMLSIATVLFSSVLYYLEETCPSIIHAFWWAIVTMTTVGYGDQVPETFGGKLLGSLCAVSGVIIVALTVPVFASKFQLYYSNVEKEPSLQKSKTFKKPKKVSPLD